jgi:hypothetical protein
LPGENSITEKGENEMKNFRVIAIALAMAFTAQVVTHGNRTQGTQQIGGVIGYLAGGDLKSTAEGAVIGGVVGGVVGALAGGLLTIPAGGAGAIPGAEIGVAAGGF